MTDTRRLYALLIFAACALVVLVGMCHPKPRPPAAAGVQQGEPVLYIADLNPPPIFAHWYAEAEQCTGLKGEFENVRWFVTPHPWRTKKGTTFGVWRPPHRIIVNQDDMLKDSVLVTHESIHDILSYQQLSDTATHPKFAYNGVCAKASY